MRILMVGDVIGRPGRAAFSEFTSKIRAELSIDIVIVNGENAAGGKGITKPVLDELTRAGADIVTSGNHIWDKKEIFDFIDDEPFLVRPANYPEGAPGKGFCVYPLRGKNVGVMNLSGRSFMDVIDCPFQKSEDILRTLRSECDVILLDFHAETTSEKMAMGFYLDGRISALAGTHTHVQTADERVLPKGTAYITDLGMTGPLNSVIGAKIESALRKFTTGLPAKFDIAEGPSVYSAAVFEIDEKTGLAKSVSRIMKFLEK